MAKNRFGEAASVKPPKITRRARQSEAHGKVRKDYYAWLRADNWQEVLRNPEALPHDIRATLEAENRYYEAVTNDLHGLRRTLFEEMRGRIKEDDRSISLPDGAYQYWVEYRQNGEYPVYRRARLDGGDAVTIFDGDAERGDGGFFSVGAVTHSPDHAFAACAVDRLGSENYRIEIVRIASGERLSDIVQHADAGGAVWTASSDAFFYVERDESQRSKRVKLHRLGQEPADDVVVYEEPDDGFFLHLQKSQSGEFIFIVAGNHTTSEVRYLPANRPDAAPSLIARREFGVEYSVEHAGDDFIILNNAGGAVDFRLSRAPCAAPERENWTDIEPHAPGRLILDFWAFKSYIVRLERRDALPRIVISPQGGDSYEIVFSDPAYALGVIGGYEFDVDEIRFTYESPATPQETYIYNMRSRERTLIKTQEVPSGHSKSDYLVDRIVARARDGASIPVTLLRRRAIPLDGKSGVVLYGYGSYGLSIPADFSSAILSLVDRGATFAIAHVRGGAERGRDWYHSGKLAKKKNTFDDFEIVARRLVKLRYAAKGGIVIYGGSAGGMLVGAAVNRHPELYAGVLGAVPFVDVLNTISDAGLPLTPPEWEEWGNPIESAEDFDRIAEYSPYENVRRAMYPPIMATAGLADYRVTYWEPAKWIAQLRHRARGGPFVLRTNMDAGHGGAGARFEKLDERAHLYAFALKALGLENEKPRPRGAG